MEQMSRDLHRSLAWLSAAHDKTQTPNIHTIVRGRDQEERPLRMEATMAKWHEGHARAFAGRIRGLERERD